MSNTSKSHWPPPELPDFIPEGWLPLFEAYKLVGRAQFGDAWMDGRELAAPGDKDLEAKREARARATSRQEEKAKHLAGAKRASVGASVDAPHRPRRAQTRQPPARAPYKGPPWPLFNEESRTEARARGDWVWNQLRQWLCTDKVSQMVLDNYGVQHTPPKSVWASAGATSILHTGRIEVGDQSGFTFVSISQIDAAIHGEQGGDGSAFQKEPQEKKSASQAVPSPRGGSHKGKATVGRPSLKTEIEDACNELIAANKACLDKRKPNFEPIRQIIRKKLKKPPDADIKGLTDEAIRKIIAPILDDAKAASHKPSH